MSTRPSIAPAVLVVLVVAGLAAGAWFLWFAPAKDGGPDAATWVVERRELHASVVEGGSLEALRTTSVVNEVEGQSTIVALVDQGRVITPEDVAAGLVLVQLDSSGIQDRVERERIELAAADAAHSDAVSTLEIQLQQNASDLRKAELDVRFARLDLERYVGRTLTERLLRTHGEGLAVATEEDRASGEAPAVGLRRLILTLLESEELEGESLQSIRKLDSDIRLAEEEETRGRVKLDWTVRLLEKGYVSREDHEADRIALERLKIETERSKTARLQFVNFDFAKEVERLLSNLVEAADHQKRVERATQAAFQRADSEVRSRLERLQLQRNRVEKADAQLRACHIRATQPGLVVYPGGRRGRWNSEEAIKKGQVVRERQVILEIPDLSSIGVRLDVHESVVERVKEGQRVTVTVDALPDMPLHGVVHNVGRLPNPPDGWLNPDLKVYATDVVLDVVPPQLRPGMSAKVEIHVADLEDVVTVPVQAVGGPGDAPTVWVVASGGATPRRVELGVSDDRHVEVRSGLAAGETVLLAPPATAPNGGRPSSGRPAGGRPPSASR